MKILLSTLSKSRALYDKWRDVIAGEFLTPTMRYERVAEDLPFALDNGVMSSRLKGIDRFLKALEALEPHKKDCLFVVVLDVLGDARRTLESFWYWKEKLAGWPLAFVAQPGIQHLPIPWDSFQSLFVGGRAFSQSKDAVALIYAAKLHKKMVHIGGLNSPRRYAFYSALGADTCDGVTYPVLQENKFEPIRKILKRLESFEQNAIGGRLWQILSIQENLS